MLFHWDSTTMTAELLSEFFWSFRLFEQAPLSESPAVFWASAAYLLSIVLAGLSFVRRDTKLLRCAVRFQLVFGLLAVMAISQVLLAALCAASWPYEPLFYAARRAAGMTVFFAFLQILGCSTMWLAERR